MGRRFVVDTCSFGFFHDKIGKQHGPKALKGLSPFVESGEIVFPRQVLDELADFRPASRSFYPKEWARKHADLACSHGPDLKTVKAMLKSYPQVAKVLDSKKTSGKDEADPYVLALGLELSAVGHEVTVVTEDRADKSAKLSVVTACGYLRLVCLPMRAMCDLLGVKLPPTT